MKLVIMTRVTEHCETHALPMEYKSKEAVKKEFIRLAKKHYRDQYCHTPFKFGGYVFDSHSYYFVFSDGDIWEMPPAVYTLEEWFDKYKNGKF